MVSLIDALMVAPVALFCVAFLVPALILATGTGEEFRKSTSLAMADTVTQSFAMAFLHAEKNDVSNIQAAAQTMSGNSKNLNWEYIDNPPPMYSYFKVYFDSPYDSDKSLCGSVLDNILGAFNRKKTPDKKSCDFTVEAYGAKKFEKQTRKFRLPIPVRGGESGQMIISYEVN